MKADVAGRGALAERDRSASGVGHVRSALLESRAGGEEVDLPPDPVRPHAGLAVWNAPEPRAQDSRHRPKDLVATLERHAAVQMRALHPCGRTTTAPFVAHLPIILALARRSEPISRSKAT